MFEKNGVFGGVTGFIVLMWLIWHFNSWMSDNDVKTLPVYETDAAALVQKFDDNEPGATAELEGKRIAVTGIIRDFDMTLNTPSVSLKGIGGAWSNDDVVVNLADKAIAMKLHKGDSVTLVGIEPTVTMGSVFLKSGVIYNKPKPKPEAESESTAKNVDVNVDCNSIAQSVVLIWNGREQDTLSVMSACDDGARWAMGHHEYNQVAHNPWKENTLPNRGFSAGKDEALKQIHAYLEK